MANETIEDIVRDVRHVSELHGMSYNDDKNWHLTIHNYTRILADRIEKAHKCSAGDVDGNEDCRACKQFVSKEVSALRALVVELANALKTHESEISKAMEMIEKERG